MTSLADALADLGDALAGVAGAGFEVGGMRTGQDEVLRVLAEAGLLQRLVDAVTVAAVSQIGDHDDIVVHAERTTTRYGCRNLNELIQRATRMPGARAGRTARRG